MIWMTFYVGASFGLAYLVGHAVITRAVREWLAAHGRLLEWLVLMLECPACFGWWSGLGAGLFLTYGSPLGGVLIGLYTMGTNFLLGRATGLIGNPRGD